MSHMSNLDVERQIYETGILMEQGWSEEEAQAIVEGSPTAAAEQLHNIYSDTHKDVFGFRPRHMTQDQIQSVEWLKWAIDNLDNMPA